MIRTAVRQPVSVAVGVLLVLLGGVVAFQRIAIQLTPNVEDTIVAVTTFWEGASPQEVEQEVVDEQEDKLQGLSGLRTMTSKSQQGTGTIRLQFEVGTPKEVALREVSEKLREVPEYPDGVDEPVIEASDPDTQDYIAWVVLGTTDPHLDIRDLNDFASDRIVPAFERIPGMAEVNALGGREREVQIHFDPAALAQRGITITEVVSAIQRTNQNRSAGEIPESKFDVRLRLVSKFASVKEVERTVIAETEGGPVWLSDVATVVETFKEPRAFVRSRGRPVIAINFQREIGSNVMEVMEGLRGGIERLNQPGGLLDRHAREMGLDGVLSLDLVYDQTVYIDEALLLVRNNIWIGGALAIGVLLLFLRSLRSAGIISMAIPISVIGAVVAMVAMGRSVNVISLAGMAFAVGMVVDNAIVVLENVYRHLELGKSPFEAAVEGTREVFGAIVASTLTTVCVFVPILLIEEEAGQLFRDIALAIVAAVSLSLLVSVTVIPTAASKLLRPRAEATEGGPSWLSRKVGDLVYALSGSVILRLLIVAGFTAASVVGTAYLLPPSDYLPVGNRNLFFGLLIPPPGYNLEQKSELGSRVEASVRPFWEAGLLEEGSTELARAEEALPSVPTFDMATMSPGPPVTPPPLENYFIVSFEDVLFHGAISKDPTRVPDVSALFSHATRSDVLPGVFAFGFQVPLFQLGGTTGAAVKIDFVGDDLDEVTQSALAVFLELMGKFGPGTTQPDPSNFNVYGPELRVVPDRLRLAEAGMTPADLGLAVQALGDGAIIGDYEIGGQTIDLKLVARGEVALGDLGQTPLATPAGHVRPLSTLGDLRRVNAAAQINRVARQRSVTLQFTPQGVPLEQAVDEVSALLVRNREAGVIPDSVDTSFSGSASKLEAVRTAMLGDGSVAGTLSSSLVLALLVVYLLMCVLFQSFARPAVILFSVPLATLGGFFALKLVHDWSLSDPYMPDQNLDVLTMLGFVILLGVVVNNAILILHQSIHFMKGEAETTSGERRALPPREAIAEATRTRVRPILMGTLTSVGGMAPLVLMPGAGSELYRGLGAVVLGGLLVSTVFTLILVPLLFSLLCDLQQRFGWLNEARAPQGAVAGAVALLLLFGLPLSGCRAPGPDSGHSGEDLVQRVREQRIRDLGSVPEEGLRFERAGTGVADALEGRREELEAQGGPESWSARPVRFETDLFGRPQEVLAVELDELLAEAARNNLGLRRAELEPEILRAERTVAESAYDTSVFASAEHERNDRPQPVPRVFDPGTSTFITVGVGESRSRRSNLSLGLRRDFEVGATVEASTFVERYDDRTNGLLFDPDPAWRSGIALSVEQPLLRGAGGEFGASAARSLELREERADALVSSRALDLAFGVETAYWDLYQAWQELRILEGLVESGEAVERVLAERRSFDAEPAQYSDALATVESRRSQLVRARLAVRRGSDRVKALVQAERYPPGSEVLLEPGEAPDPSLAELHPERDLATALAERPEMRAALLGLEDSRLAERVAANLEQAELNLYGEVELLGEDDAYASANQELDDFVNWLLGLSYELPLGNRGAKAERRRARLVEREAALAYEEAALAVVDELKAALRDVETAGYLIEATRNLRLAQTENLRALLAEEEERTELTPEFLSLKFQRQDRLALAQLDELGALCDYARAVALYERAVGRR